MIQTKYWKFKQKTKWFKQKKEWFQQKNEWLQQRIGWQNQRPRWFQDLVHRFTTWHCIYLVHIQEWFDSRQQQAFNFTASVSNCQYHAVLFFGTFV